TSAFLDVPTLANPALSATCGLDIVLVIDSSSSIDDQELQEMKDAFKGFVDALLPDSVPNPTTEFAVVDFDRQVNAVLEFTNVKAAILNAIDAPTSGGSTNWDDALDKARLRVPHREGHPGLILFASDGNPNTR